MTRSFQEREPKLALLNTRYCLVAGGSKSHCSYLILALRVTDAIRALQPRILMEQYLPQGPGSSISGDAKKGWSREVIDRQEESGAELEPGPSHRPPNTF